MPTTRTRSSVSNHHSVYHVANVTLRYSSTFSHSGKFWTGRKIIGIYQLLLFGSLACELALLSTCLRAAGEYAEVYPILEDGGTHEYVSLENAAQVKFNSIYFSARTTCTGKSCGTSSYDNV